MKIKLLDKQCKPLRAYKTDSGLDLRARIDRELQVFPCQAVVIPVGIAVELPSGCEGQVRGRSGWTEKGLIIPTGTIDNSYRGEVKVTVINASSDPVYISPYDRIAQLVVCPVIVPEIEFVEELSQSDRGDNGHGSTGVE